MNIWENVGDITTSIGQALVNAFEVVSSIFYTPGSSGVAGGPTFVGYIALGGLAISALTLGINFITRLLTRRLGR